jgi:hypothetical protein
MNWIFKKCMSGEGFYEFSYISFKPQIIDWIIYSGHHDRNFIKARESFQIQ